MEAVALEAVALEGIAVKGRIRIKTIRTSRRKRQPFCAAQIEQNSNRPGFLKFLKIIKTEHFQR